MDPTEEVHFPFSARLYRSVRLSQPIDSAATVVAIRVQLLNPKYHRGGAVQMQPLRTIEMSGLQCGDRIYLPERVVLCRDRTSVDVAVKITVDGVVVHEGRLKYMNTGQHGIQNVTANQFFLDPNSTTDQTAITPHHE